MARTDVFDLAGGDDAADGERNLFWLRVFLLLHVAARTIIALHNPNVSPETWLTVTYSLLIAVCLPGLIPRLYATRDPDGGRVAGSPDRWHPARYRESHFLGVPVLGATGTASGVQTS
jgi:hypothetical protein